MADYLHTDGVRQETRITAAALLWDEVDSLPIAFAIAHPHFNVICSDDDNKENDNA